MWVITESGSKQWWSQTNLLKSTERLRSPFTSFFSHFFCFYLSSCHRTKESCHRTNQKKEGKILPSSSYRYIQIQSRYKYCGMRVGMLCPRALSTPARATHRFSFFVRCMEWEIETVQRSAFRLYFSFSRRQNVDLCKQKSARKFSPIVCVCVRAWVRTSIARQQNRIRVLNGLRKCIALDIYR